MWRVPVRVSERGDVDCGSQMAGMGKYSEFVKFVYS